MHTLIVGSPFVIEMAPGTPVAGLTVCRGAALREAAVNVSQTFSIRLHDQFNNPLHIGGSRFLIRLTGGNIASAVPPVYPPPSSVPPRPDVVIPLCADARNGVYTCVYTPRTHGPHQLHISLLQNPPNYPGGDGLFAYYYDSYEPLAPGLVPIASRVDPTIFFSWDSGYIIPAIAPQVVPYSYTIALTHYYSVAYTHTSLHHDIRTTTLTLLSHQPILPHLH